MKSNRIKKPANREPTSLAIPTSIRTQVPPSSPNQLQDVIDPRLLEHDAQLPNKAIINTVKQPELDLIELDSTKFASLNDDLSSNTQTREFSQSTTPGYNPSTNDSQVTKGLDNKGKTFLWTFVIEEAMFNKLVQQVVDLSKQADNEFKKEAWTAVIKEIKQKTSKEVLLEHCKNKVDIMKSY